ncbi:MAG: hypothetical protein IJG50_01045 [Clostridia bacterium]|nr:hypothetical protein [Clostridia bacterium]
MKTKRLLSMIIVIAMCLTVLPAAALAAPVTDADDFDASVIYGVSMSAGVWGGGRTYVAGVDENDEMRENLWGALVSDTGYYYGADYHPEPVQFYFGGEEVHRLTLYSTEQLDPSLFEIFGNEVSQLSDFSETVVGRGQTACYLYRAMISCPQMDTNMEIIYNNYLVARIECAGAPEGNMYVAEVNITEKNSDGSLVMEISGYGLPAGEEGVGLYAICNEDYESDDVEFVPVYTATELVDSQPNLGIYSYKMEPTGEEPQDSWFPVCLVTSRSSIQLCFYGNNEEGVTIPRLGPMNASGDTPVYVTPPKVTVPSTTNTPKVTASITPGDYTNMRYNTDDGAWSEWQPIASTVDFTFAKDDFGYHTVYFQFNDGDGGHNTKLQYNVLYLDNTQAAAPTDVGIKDANRKIVPKTADGKELLFANEGYFVYATCGEESEALSLEALVYYGDDTATDLSQLPVTLYEMSKNGDTNVYVTDSPLMAGVDNYRIGVRVKKGENQMNAGKIAEVSAVGQTLPNVYNATSPWIPRGYARGAYKVTPGAEMTCNFYGSAGATLEGYIELTYESNETASALKTVRSAPLKATGYYGMYSGSVKVPDDAEALVSVKYFIEDTSLPATVTRSGLTREFSVSEYEVMSNLVISGFDANYEGTNIKIWRRYDSGDYVWYYQTDLNGSESVTIPNVEKGSYKYEITGGCGEIASGTFEVTKGGGVTKLALDLPKIANLTIRCLTAGLPYWTYADYSTPSGAQGRVWFYGRDTAEINHIPILPTAASMNVTLAGGTSWGDVRGIVGGTTVKTISGSDTVDVEFENFTRGSLEGTLLTPLGTPAAHQYVSYTQEIKRVDLNGLPNLYVNSFSTGSGTYTDENGHFVFDNIYTQYDAKLSVGGGKYAAQTETAAAGTTDMGDISLSYRDNMIITPVLMVTPAGKSDDEAHMASANKLQPSYIYVTHADGSESYVSFSVESDINGNSMYFIDSYYSYALAPGDTVTVYFNRLPAEEQIELYNSADDSWYQSYTAVLDEDLNAVLTVTAKEKGSISATVAEEGSDETGYLLVYDGYTLMDMESGQGELTVSYLPQRETSAYTVIGLKVKTGDEIALRSLSDPYGIRNRVSRAVRDGEATYKETSLALGQVLTLSDMAPAKVAGSSVLGGALIDVTTEPVPGHSGWLAVKISATKKFAGVLYTNAYITKYNGLGLTHIDAFDYAYSGGKETKGSASSGQTSYVVDLGRSEADPFILIYAEAKDGYVRGEASINYIDASGYSGTERVSFDVEAEQFELSAPAKVTYNGGGEVPVTVYGKEGDEVTIYDGGREAGTATLNYKGQATVTISLSEAEKLGVHEIYASKDVDGETVYTSRHSVSLVDIASSPYVSNFHWEHRNDQGWQDWYFNDLSELQGITLRFWPSNKSRVSFRINNVNDYDVENVKFVKVYSGMETEFETEFVQSGTTVDSSGVSHPWAEYKVKTTTEDETFPVGYFDTFTVRYDYSPALSYTGTEAQREKQQAEAYYKAYGGKLTSFEDMVEATSSLSDADYAAIANEAKENLPKTFRDHLNDADAATKTTVEVIENKADKYSYAISQGSENKMSTTVDMTDKTVYQSSDIKALYDAYLENGMEVSADKKTTTIWTKYDSDFGTVYEKRTTTDNSQYNAAGDALTDGGVLSVSTVTDKYLPKAAVDAMMSDAASIAGGPTGELTLVRITGEIMGGEQLRRDMGITRAALSTASTEEASLQAAHAAAASGVGKYLTPAVKGYASQGMLIVGATYTTYKISKGPQGKDSSTLYATLNLLDPRDLKSAKAIQTLSNEIQAYEALRAKVYLDSSLVNGGSVAGKALTGGVPPVKLGLTIGTLGYNGINKLTLNNLSQEFDSIMRSICAEIARQDQRRIKDREQYERELYEKWRKIAERENWNKADRERLIREAVEDVLNGRVPPLYYRFDDNFPKFNLYIDPSGYVFEATEDNRVSGITSTIMEGTGSGFVDWSDPNENVDERQENPILTSEAATGINSATGAEYTEAESNDAKGRYGWDVPAGEWKVRFEDKRESAEFADAETKSMTVPPEHTQVNIGLMSTKAPEVVLVATTKDKSGAEVAGSVTIGFSKYMQMESLVDMSAEQSAKIPSNTDSYDSAKTKINFFDADGNLISGKITFVPEYRVPNTGYLASSIYQTDVVMSDYFAKRVIFTADDPAAFDLENSNVLVAHTAVSYAGVAMSEDFLMNTASAIGEKTGEEEIASVTRTDKNTGESIACTVKTSSVTVTGSVKASTPVYVAVYDGNGQMVSFDIMTAPGTEKIGNGAVVKLIWVNSGTYIAKSEVVRVSLK